MSSRILIITSALRLGALIEARLAVESYDTVLMHNGETGLASASKKRPDLVIVDTALPGISTYQTIQKIRALPSGEKIPFFVLSERSVFRDIFKDIGIQAFMVKPIIPHLLIKKIRAALDQTLPREKDPLLVEKTALIAGAELFLLNRIKISLESSSWKINLGLNQADILNELRSQPIHALIIQFWEGAETWDAKKIIRSLRAEIVHQKTSVIVFCCEPLRFEAIMQMKNFQVISFVKVPDLLSQLKTRLVELS